MKDYLIESAEKILSILEEMTDEEFILAQENCGNSIAYAVDCSTDIKKYTHL